MTRNSKPPAARQQVLFSQAAQRLVELSNDKQQELRTAVAELLLNAIAGDKPIDSGETDDESQAHA
jgi:anti-sigma regulatory factor (Ser/Thr protein kinase)